jgi:acetyl/propionyl-CoA carboxylase alpha subunit
MIEECPSPSIGEELRRAMGEAAVRLARQARYHSAGTIEFIVDSRDRFYFLEANTRLQVEHPVTEWVTGIDLVKAQIKIAEGHRLPMAQEEIRVTGHAVECRLYAEDPEHEFLPSEGVVGVLREPARPGVRVDSALREGRPVVSLYDPMLAKLTAYGFNRKEALLKMDALLRDYVLLGVRHNLDFLRFVVNSEAFSKGRYHTHTVQELLPEFLKTRKTAEAVPAAAYIAAALLGRASLRREPAAIRQTVEPLSALRGFRNA